MKTIITILMFSLLTACGKSNSEQTTNEAEVATPPAIDHYYSLKDGYEYGYEPAVSEDAQNAGQVATTLLMFKYAGQREGVYQAYMKDEITKIVTSVQCTNPCDFIKIMTFYGDDTKAQVQRMKATPNTIGWLVMSDAINGKLDQVYLDKNGKKFSVWLDENVGLQIAPENI